MPRYCARRGRFLQQEDYAFYPFAELLRLRDRLYDILGKSGRLPLPGNAGWPYSCWTDSSGGAASR